MLNNTDDQHFSDITGIKGIRVDKQTIPWQQAVALYAIHRSNTITGRDGRSGEDGGGSNVSGSVKENTVKEKNTQFKNNFAVDTASNDEFSLSRFSRLMQMILELVYDPKLFGLQKRERLSSQIDYSDISRYLHLAEFTADHVIVLDRVPSESLAMHFSADDLVGMVCWLAVDIDEALELYKILRDELSNEVRFLAEEFADRYLSPEEILLKNKDKKQRTELLDLLLHIFHEIMRWHPPVDAFTQEVADAVEDYLQEGKSNIEGDYDRGFDSDFLSGSEKFDLWEFLCLDNYLEGCINNRWEVMIVDRGNLPDRIDLCDAVKSYYKGIKGGENQNYFGNMRPDLIIYKVVNQIVDFRIIDFKYYDYDKVKNKIEPEDCRKIKEDKVKNNKAESEDCRKTNADAENFYCNEEKNDIPKSQIYTIGVTSFYQENANLNNKPLSISLEFWVVSPKEERDNPPIDGETKLGVYSATLHGLPIQTMIKNTLSRYKAFTRS